jgi:hypothetical protein
MPTTTLRNHIRSAERTTAMEATTSSVRYLLERLTSRAIDEKWSTSTDYTLTAERVDGNTEPAHRGFNSDSDGTFQITMSTGQTFTVRVAETV